MKKKFCLILSLAILAFHVLPITNVFAALPPYKPPEGEHLDPKDYYINYESKGIKLLQRPELLLSVNHAQNDRISYGGSLVFTAKVLNDPRVPDPTEINFSYTIGGSSYTNSVPVSNGEATFTLNYDEIPTAVPDMEYVMTASYTENGIEAKAQVRFGILGDNPAIVFTEPGVKNTVSINDPLHFIVKTFRGTHSTTLTVSWRCGSNLSAGYTCPSNNAEATDLAFTIPGTYNITVTVTDNNGLQSTNTVTIKVVEDSPYISAFTIPDEFEAGSIATAYIVASDKFGTINRLDWVCSNDDNITIFNQRYIPDPPAASIRYEITTQLPNAEGNIHHCTVRATDDDNIVSTPYTLVFKTHITSTDPTDPTDSTDQTNQTEPTNPVTPDEPTDPVTPTAPNTGTSTNEDASTVVDATLVALSSITLCGLFVTIAKRHF